MNPFFCSLSQVVFYSEYISHVPTQGGIYLLHRTHTVWHIVSHVLYSIQHSHTLHVHGIPTPKNTRTWHVCRHATYSFLKELVQSIPNTRYYQNHYAYATPWKALLILIEKAFLLTLAQIAHWHTIAHIAHWHTSKIGTLYISTQNIGTLAHIAHWHTSTHCTLAH